MAEPGATVPPGPARIPAGTGRPHFGMPIDRRVERGRPARLSRGVFVLSLDLELAVSTVDDPAIYRGLRPQIEGARRAVHGLLELLERHRVPATWAVVGQLFRAEGPPELSMGDWVGREIPDDQLHAPDLIRALRACAVSQEIACHGYRHLNMASPELPDAVIDEELRACSALADEQGVELRSFVFPFNRIGRLELLSRHGYTAFRGANSEWYTWFGGAHRGFALARGLLKLLDDAFALPPPVDVPVRVAEGLWRIPHSMFYKGAGPRSVPVGRQVRKALRGLDRAAKRRGVFHLWTHPQNLGVETKSALEGLDRVLRRVRELSDRGRLEIATMGDLARRLDGAGDDG